jgi:hypothetical protein
MKSSSFFYEVLRTDVVKFLIDVVKLLTVVAKFPNAVLTIFLRFACKVATDVQDNKLPTIV